MKSHTVKSLQRAHEDSILTAIADATTKCQRASRRLDTSCKMLDLVTELTRVVALHTAEAPLAPLAKQARVGADVATQAADALVATPTNGLAAALDNTLDSPTLWAVARARTNELVTSIRDLRDVGALLSSIETPVLEKMSLYCLQCNMFNEQGYVKAELSLRKAARGE